MKNNVCLMNYFFYHILFLFYLLSSHFNASSRSSNISTVTSCLEYYSIKGCKFILTTTLSGIINAQYFQPAFITLGAHVGKAHSASSLGNAELSLLTYQILPI